MLPPNTKLIEEFLIAREIRDVVTAAEAGLFGVVKFQRRDESRNIVAFNLSFEVSPEITWNCGRIVLRQQATLPKWLAPRIGRQSIRELVPKQWTKLTASIVKGAEWNTVAQHKKALRSVLAKFGNLLVYQNEGVSGALIELPQQPPELQGQIDLPVRVSVVDENKRARELPEIPAHYLKERREKVRKLKLDGGYTRKQIAAAVEESEHVVKKDLKWLKDNELMGEDLM